MAILMHYNVVAAIDHGVIIPGMAGSHAKAVR